MVRVNTSSVKLTSPLQHDVDVAKLELEGDRDTDLRLQAGPAAQLGQPSTTGR